jgi:hypothetical protein
MQSIFIDRMLIIESRLVDGYELTETGHKNLQHIFTTWLPRAIYSDIPGDTVKVIVIVRRGIIFGKSVFETSFIGSDGADIKGINYEEDRVVGKACQAYDQSKTTYAGKFDGFDRRYVYYTA